jgi:hypothetical protein
MALTANTANVQFLADDARHTLVKLILHQDTAGDEADVLKVNVSTLVGRTLILNTTAVALPSYSTFVPGEKLTGGTSGTTAYVCQWIPSTATVNGAITVTSNSAAFTNGETVTGEKSGLSVVLTAAGTTVPTYLIDIESVWFSVTGTGKVELAFDDAGTKKPVLHLNGTGYYGRNQLSSAFPNIMAVPNGNLYISTYGVPAKGGYCLIVDLRKQAGFAPRPVS